ncbi:Ada metal-binding domain-containing protein [Methanosarcina sp. T3]|uniref:Ada metal-binding domain-containing protein n=1 Tax=Methanosarcina sp. T3 TaxID=3439062 RepID=UPI003F83B227
MPMDLISMKSHAYYRVEPASVFTAASQVTPSSEPTPTPNSANAEYQGNPDSKVFHEAGCRYAPKISPESLVIFYSREEAIAAGYRPCEVCNP